MRLIAIDCPVAVDHERICETHRRFVFTTSLAISSRSVASSVLNRRSRIPKPAPSNWPVSFVTRRFVRSNQPKTNTPAASASPSNRSARTKSAESSSMVWSPPKWTSPRLGIVSPTSRNPAAIHCNRSPTDHPRSCGEKIPTRLADNGRSFESVGPPIRSIWSKSPPEASVPDAGCEPVLRTAICSSWTRPARSKRSRTQPANKSASPPATIRLNGSAARSKAAARINTSSSILMVTDHGSLIRPSKHCFASQPNG